MAAFAPLADLRLIVVDEAHDGAYKSDRTPRYDARWVARRRAALTGARLVLGTATPDVVTLSRVRGGLVERARLVERRVGRAPAVEIVDMRAELAEANRSIFSRALTDALGVAAGGERAGDPAHEPARRRDLRPVPRLRREPALPGLRPAVRLPPGRVPAALPPLRPDGAARRRPARTAGAVGSATSAPGRSGSRRRCGPDSRACASRAWTPTRSPSGAASRRSTTTSATGGSTSWSGRSSPPRGSTCRA